MSNGSSSGGRRGCFVDGCLIGLVAFVVIGGGLMLGYSLLVKRDNKIIAQYTEGSPMTLPRVELSAEQLAALKERVAVFGQALKDKSNTAPLVLNAPEINALLADSQVVREMNLRGKFWLSLEGGEVRTLISRPIGEYYRMPLVNTKGRYLNCTGRFTVGVTNGAAVVIVQSLEAKGRPVREFMEQLEGRNLAEEINKDPTNAAIFNRIQTVGIKGEHLIITAKP